MYIKKGDSDMIVPRHYENLRVLHDGTMPARAYYIPASKPMDNLVENRDKSDRIQFLNGSWRFRYFDSIYDVKDKFFEPGYDASGFHRLNVPGCGRWTDMILISIPISAIHFPLTRPTFLRTFHAAHICRNLSIRKRKGRLKHT